MSSIENKKGYDILDSYAKNIVSKGLGTVAILFIESMKPLNFIGSQALHFFNPLLTLIPYFKNFDKLADLLEDRENIDYFLNKIEDYMNKKNKDKNNKND